MNLQQLLLARRMNDVQIREATGAHLRTIRAERRRLGLSAFNVQNGAAYDRIRQALAGGQTLTVREAAAVAGVMERCARRWLLRMEAEGEAVRVGRRWCCAVGQLRSRLAPIVTLLRRQPMTVAALAVALSEDEASVQNLLDRGLQQELVCIDDIDDGVETWTEWPARGGA